MEATALAGRRALPERRRKTAAAHACGLAFEDPGGPLVAVCGLAGGAGTTTLALQLARQAARESPAPVLVCEAEALAGGLAAAAGATSVSSLGELAGLVAAGGRPPAGAVAALDHNLRLLATTPRRPPAVGGEALARVLSDARAAHGIVVCDCRTLDHVAAAALLAAATHVLWVLPATPAALGHAAALIAAEALPPPGRANEALVAVAAASGASASVRALRALGGDRHDRLILVPHTPDPAAAPAGAPHGRTLAALTQLATFLRPRR